MPERAYCANCGKEVGGLVDRLKSKLTPIVGKFGWSCPSCRKWYCEDCARSFPKVGLISKSPTCPGCGRALQKMK